MLILLVTFAGIVSVLYGESRSDVFVDDGARTVARRGTTIGRRARLAPPGGGVVGGDGASGDGASGAGLDATDAVFVGSAIAASRSVVADVARADNNWRGLT